MRQDRTMSYLAGYGVCKKKGGKKWSFSHGDWKQRKSSLQSQHCQRDYYLGAKTFFFLIVIFFLYLLRMFQTAKEQKCLFFFFFFFVTITAVNRKFPFHGVHLRFSAFSMMAQGLWFHGFFHLQPLSRQSIILLNDFHNTIE